VVWNNPVEAGSFGIIRLTVQPFLEIAAIMASEKAVAVSIPFLPRRCIKKCSIIIPFLHKMDRQSFRYTSYLTEITRFVNQMFALKSSVSIATAEN